MSFSIRDWQKAALTRIFRLGNVEEDDTAADGEAAASWSDEWKVLVFDGETRAIISPLLNVAELRNLGVTLHLGIESARDTIPDVSAVYFLSPTATNVRYLIDDAAAGKYRDMSLHFSTPVPRPLLETLARGTVEGGAVPRIRRVWDQYLSFVALEHRLFSLNMKNSYASYASASVNDADIESYCRHVAIGLLSVCATTGVMPLIVAARDGPAEMVARVLEGMIRDHLASPDYGVFSATLGSGVLSGGGPRLPGGRRPTPIGFGAGARPVLLLVDRNVDMAVPLSHASTYAALVDDCIGPLALNRVTVVESSGGAGGGDGGSGGGAGWLDAMTGGSSAAAAAKKGKVYNLDVENDAFWRAHSADEFPVAIDAHEAELRAVVAREDAIRRSAGGTNPDDATAAALGLMDGPDTSSADLVSAIDSLPALLKRKRVLETHTALMHAVMERVAARTIPHFYDAELPAIMGSGSMDKSAVYAMVRDGGKGSIEDRARLAAAYLMSCTPTATSGSGSSGGGIGGIPSAASGAAALTEEYNALVEALTASVRSAAATGAGAAASTTGSGAAATADGGALPPAAAASLATAKAALAYIKHLRCTPSLGGMSAAASAADSPFARGLADAVGGGTGGRLLASLTQHTTNILNLAAQSVTRLVGGETRMALSRITAAVCDGKPSAASAYGVDNFLVLDPRASTHASSSATSAGGAAASVRERTFGNYVSATMAAAAAVGGGVAAPPTFRNAFVFVVGGGSYAEYHDLLRLTNAGGPRAGAGGGSGSSGGAGSGGVQRTVVYGATEMLHPGAFMAQLAELGKAHVR